jgi:hypothetical protein
VRVAQHRPNPGGGDSLAPGPQVSREGQKVFCPWTTRPPVFRANDVVRTRLAASLMDAASTESFLIIRPNGTCCAGLLPKRSMWWTLDGARHPGAMGD